MPRHASSQRLLGERQVLWLIGAVVVGVTVLATTFTGVGATIAVAAGALVALAALGLALWRGAPNRQEAKSSLGTGLLVSVVVAAAVGSAQFAIDDRRSRLERERDLAVRLAESNRANAARQVADLQALRITVSIESHLVGIDLSGRNLRKVYLGHKQLQNATFVRANLSGANLDGAHLRWARFPRAALDHASFRRADLRDGVLVKADLTAANLNDAKLQHADFSSTKLRGTKFVNAKLTDATLLQADLRGASLVGVKLDAADLERADLRNADLSFADLRKAENLLTADLRGSSANSATRWPVGFDLDAAGVQVVDQR